MRTAAELKIAIAEIDDQLEKLEGKTGDQNLKKRRLLTERQAGYAKELQALLEARPAGGEATHEAPASLALEDLGPLWSVLGNLCPCANDGTKSHGEYCVRGAGAKLPGTPPRAPASPEMQRLKTEPVESLRVPVMRENGKVVEVPTAERVSRVPEPEVGFYVEVPDDVLAMPAYRDPAVQELAKAITPARPNRDRVRGELYAALERLRRVAEEIHRWAGSDLPAQVRHELEAAIRQAGGTP